jgi:hypothetical protein
MCSHIILLHMFDQLFFFFGLMEPATAEAESCEGFHDLEAALRPLRKIDDNIVYELNKIDVNSKQQCADVWQRLGKGMPAIFPPPSIYSHNPSV